MPRAILAQSAFADRSRTVSSVSDELGVSPSTLRTWERRYGLGPAQRETGERRRYQPEDVDRLRVMIHHVRAGMPAAEAAKRALAESTLLPRRGPANAAQLRTVTLSDDYHRLEEVIEAAVASHGLVHTWSRFVEPTLKSLRSDPGGEPVGSAPALSSEGIASRSSPTRSTRPQPKSSASPWPGTAATCACCPAKTTGACRPWIVSASTCAAAFPH